MSSGKIRYNRDLLVVGTSISAYASIDRGKSWSRFAAGLPSVPVFDLKIHPRDHELIAATHGRGFWIVDIAPLEQVTPKVVAAEATLFEPHAARQWGEGPTLMASGNGNAQAFFATPNPSYGADLSYRIGPVASPDTVRFVISNAAGDTLATLTGPSTPGVHNVNWNFAMRAAAATPAPLSPSERRDSILKAGRGPKVLDSLKAAGYDTTALARARTLLFPPAAGGRGGAAGGRGGRGGRGGNPANCERPLTQWDPFCARPAEPAPAPAGRGGGGGGRGGAEPANVVKVFDLIGIKVAGGGGRGGGGGFRGGGNLAGAGDYLVTMTFKGKSYRQVLHIEP